MYQKSFRHFFVGIETSIFYRLAVWWNAERLKACCALLCFAFRSHGAVEMKKQTSLSVSLSSWFFQFYSPVLILGSVWCIQCALSFSFLLPLCFPSLFYPLPSIFLSPPLPLSFFPLSLWFSYFHLKSGSFPGGENLVELRETTGSDLFIMLCVCLWLF